MSNLYNKQISNMKVIFSRFCTCLEYLQNKSEIMRISAFIIISTCFLSVHVQAQFAKSCPKYLGATWAGSTMPYNFDKYFNQISPENAGKWGMVEPVRNQYNWGDLDSMYAYCERNHIPFKLHTFVWGNQKPNWIDGLSPSDQKAELLEFMTLCSQRYPNVAMIDVVNEALPNHAPPSFKNAIGGDNGLYGTGWDWIVWSFENARRLFPNAKLILNDYHLLNDYPIGDQYPGRYTLEMYLEIVNVLKSRGLIDGMGDQSHFYETTNWNDLLGRWSRLEAVGVPIYITEFDLNNSFVTANGDTIADDNAQKQRCADLFSLWWSSNSVKGITMWDYLQGHTWQRYAYLIRSDLSERPAFTWIRNYLAQQCQNGSAGPAGYTFAVGEYGSVPVKGSMNIAYGANGSYEYLYNQTSNVGCSTASFGGKDPAPGIVKSCYTQATAPVGPAGYTFASGEYASVPVTGTMNIAYGANGSYEYLYNQTSSVGCSLATFGGKDPAPGIVKSCFTQATTPVGPAGYTFASGEYGSVAVTGTMNIAYGANGSYEYLYNQTSSVGCTLATFGGNDPAVGIVKSCFTQATTPVGPAGYTFASGEYGSVAVTGTMNIAYGANGSYEYLYNQTSNVGCTLATFGGNDPAVGIVKSCFTQATTPVGPAGYTFASGEYGSVAVTGTMNIAYGANGSYEYLYNQTSSVGCTLATFGGNDPAVGIVKNCYVQTAASNNNTSTTNPNACINVLSDASQYIVKNDWSDQNSGSGVQNSNGALQITQRQFGESILWVINTGAKFNITAGNQYTIGFDYQDDNSVGLNSLEVGFVTGSTWNGPILEQPRVFTNSGFTNSFKHYTATMTAMNSGSVNIAFKLTWSQQPNTTVNAFVKNIQICSDHSSFRTGQSNAASATSFSIYPNPTSGSATIQVSGNSTVKIMNALGNVVLQQESNNSESFLIDLSAQPSGMYIVETVVNGESTSQKLILQK
jgi:GH35 family endo-1,4-beta-xylanase